MIKEIFDGVINWFISIIFMLALIYNVPALIFTSITKDDLLTKETTEGKAFGGIKVFAFSTAVWAILWFLVYSYKNSTPNY